MDGDQQPLSNKRRRVDYPAQTPNPDTSSSPSADTAAAPSSSALLLRPTVVRGRPPLTRSTAESQAAAVRFACSVCGKVLQNGYKLDRHKRTHTGDLPFACAVCDMKFSDRHNASRHQRTCRQRRGVEQAMQTTTLSWPLWGQQPDEEGDEREEVDKNGTDWMESGASTSQPNEGGVIGLPVLNRWLFPPQRSITMDNAVT